ncbi:hypothetical protein GCM10008174_27250 [Methylopila turkensis]|uniref:Uncharacterized protein n=1 Tax=Methylopila turkensis TaxID=1437816 RepID=A0A9W6JRE7_9HYPH|nr:hypothetical protein GCM10008174_27250 [Methylopila turkensis]
MSSGAGAGVTVGGAGLSGLTGPGSIFSGGAAGEGEAGGGVCAPAEVAAANAKAAAKKR